MDGSGFDGTDSAVLFTLFSKLPTREDTHNDFQSAEDLHFWLTSSAEDVQPSYQDTAGSDNDYCVGFGASPEFIEAVQLSQKGLESHQSSANALVPAFYAPGEERTKKTQNRNAQKAYRDRKDQHVQQLEIKINELEALTSDLIIRNAQPGNFVEQLSASAKIPQEATATPAPEKLTCPSLSSADVIRP